MPYGIVTAIVSKHISNLKIIGGLFKNFAHFHLPPNIANGFSDTNSHEANPSDPSNATTFMIGINPRFTSH